MIAKGEASETPTTSKPSGILFTRSPWLIQTSYLLPGAQMFSNKLQLLLISTKARPNSL